MTEPSGPCSSWHCQAPTRNLTRFLFGPVRLIGRLPGNIRMSRISRSFIRVVTALNSAYLVSALGDRLWAFSMGIIMHRLGGMTWVAIHQLVDAAFKLSMAAKVGDTLDKMPRGRGMQLILAVNNVCITISGFSFYLLFSGFASESWFGSKAILVTAIVAGALSRVASEAQKTAFTKDWIVKLIETSNGARLSTQNGIMNMIDQLASFFTPFIAGKLLDTYSGSICCLVIICWNILSWALEAGVMLWIYTVTPALSHVKESGEESEKSSSPFQKYFRQKAFRAMFGLALLYMTVLGFDNIALSYGASQGMSAAQLGLFRSLGSLLGFAGNGVYAIIERFIGVMMTALIGLTIQNIFINFCSTSVFLPGSPFNASAYVQSFTFGSWMSQIRENVLGGNGNSTVEIAAMEEMPFKEIPASIVIFFIGITAARFGLWLADPAITQIMQETIPENERYSVNAAQNVFCEFFSILKDILVIAFPNTETFGCLVIMSCVFVFLGFAFYTSYFISYYSCSKPNRVKSEIELESKPSEMEQLVNRNLVDRALESA